MEVADFLIKAGADIELGASTPLMEAAQEGHLDLVRYLLESAADVHAQTQTGDTALTYACENGHTDVADFLLQFGADLVCVTIIKIKNFGNFIYLIVDIYIFIYSSRNMNLKEVELL